MPFKKVAKKPSVVVETKKMSADCCGIKSGCCKPGHLLIAILLIVNVLLSVCVLCRQSKIEADRVGGRANYKLVKQIYKMPAFQAQQKQQLEQALQMYQGGGTATPTATTTDTAVAQ